MKHLAIIILLYLNFGSWLIAQTENFLVYYNYWNESDVTDFQRYDFIILQAESFDGNDIEKTIQDIRSGQNQTRVYFYISLGEDDTTFNGGKLSIGNGKGPSYWDSYSQSVKYRNLGIASYYIDEWILDEINNSLVFGSDKEADRNPIGEAAYVNANDPEWQNLILEQCLSLSQSGADGFFLDTCDTANPWEGYGWIAEGIHNLIENISQAFPDKSLILNRGTFFFNPNFPVQYRWNPRKFIDYILVDNNFLDSDYIFKDATSPNFYNINPDRLLNKLVYSPKLEAELNRPDSKVKILNLDYAEQPYLLQSKHPKIFTSTLQNSTQRGRSQLIANLY
jgi:hypothetical protein